MALYPSLDRETVTKLVHGMIKESEIKWGDLDILEGCRYIALNWTKEQCRYSTLRRVLPVRRGRSGTRPGVKGEGPMGAEVHDQEQWRFPNVKITPEEKQEIIATVITIAVDVLFKNHLYTFGGKNFRQTRGAP